MKRHSFTSRLPHLVFPLLTSFMFAACAQNSPDMMKTTALDAGMPTLATQNDTLSWAYGQNIADALQKGYLANLDAELVLRSAAYALAGGEQPLTEQQTIQAIDYIMFLYRRDAQQQAGQVKANAERQQQAYFDTLLANHPDIKRHPMGFYYQQLRAGKGPVAEVGKRVSFDYRGYFLLTGELYDQTYGKRDPILHVVGSPMFPGLIQAMCLMNAGSLYRFYFPFELAFGTQGTTGIPSCTPMIYEVELHEIYKN